MPKTYTPIATYTVSGSTTNTITFNSIPQTYTDLVAIVNNNGITANYPIFRINNDSSALYSRSRLYGNGSAVTSDRATNETEGNWLIGANPTGGISFSASVINFMNYSNTTTYKTWITRSAEVTSGWIGGTVNLYRSTSAISRLDFLVSSGYYTSGSTFTLYGILKA